jgi:hypothetical protein
VHGRYRVLGGPVPEGELRRAEPDALDSASGDQHLLPPGVPSGMSVPELVVIVTDKGTSRLDLPMCS